MKDWENSAANKKKWAKGWIIEKNQKVVGHVGNFPMNYFLNKKAYVCAVLNGWVVDKKFRSHSPTKSAI